MTISIEQYTDEIFGIVDKLKTLIIEPHSPGSRIVTRYITSEGIDDEQWLNYLRDENGVVDIWLMTVTGLIGVPESERARMMSVGTFTKPVSVAMDYFADYRQGLDYTANQSGDTLTTNSEREFLKRVIAVDLALEQRRSCLSSIIRVDSWNFRMRIRRFANASAHWMNGVINVEAQDLLL